MSTWRQFFNRLVIEMARQPEVPPADIVPGFQRAAHPEVVLTETAEAVELEHQARTRAVTRLVHRTLLMQSLKAPGLRNPELIDLCLEVRAALQPSELPEGSRVLREVPPVGIRYPAPVIPGRAS